MKKTMIKGAVCAMVLSASVGMASPVFAADNVVTAGGVGTIPVTMTVAATPINVTVPTSAGFTIATNTNDATVATNYLIENKAAIGVIKVSSVKATAATGWTLSAKTEKFEELALNAKKLYLGAKVGSDAAYANLNTAYAPIDADVNPASSKAILFEAKSGGVSTALTNEAVASIVVTVVQK